MSEVIKANAPKRATFIGVVAASRVIVEPTMNGDEVEKQGLVLITMRKGTSKLRLTIGTAFLASIDEFQKNGIIDQSVEVEYEQCVKGETTYIVNEGEENEEMILHTFTGNRTVTLEPIGQDAYLALCMEEEKKKNLALLKEYGADTSDLVAYLTGASS